MKYLYFAVILAFLLAGCNPQPSNPEPGKDNNPPVGVNKPEGDGKKPPVVGPTNPKGKTDVTVPSKDKGKKTEGTQKDEDK